MKFDRLFAKSKTRKLKNATGIIFKNVYKV